MKNTLPILVLITLLSSSCENHDDINIRDSIDHWEITRTFETYPHSTLKVDTVKNDFSIDKGVNQVLIITIENDPIFKEGKELTDMSSSKSLLIELDSSDNIVSPKTPLNSKLYRKLLAFSPNYGINHLDSNENLEFIRKTATIWEMKSEIWDFEFNAELELGVRQSLTTKHHDY